MLTLSTIKKYNWDIIVSSWSLITLGLPCIPQTCCVQGYACSLWSSVWMHFGYKQCISYLAGKCLAMIEEYHLQRWTEE